MAKGLARAGFDLDLSEGVAREDAFANVICDAKVEHKRDYKAGKTGNFFCEYAQHGRPSGIAVTTADYWAIEFATCRWILVKTSELKALAQGIHRNRPKSRVKGGDFNKFDGVLIPLKALVAVEE